MSVIDDIKARLDIVDIISDTVALKKSGRSYTGFCPFHSNTKTPSFVVFPETQTWRCFGACAEGGDIFSFVMKREGYDFKTALELLADRAGVSLKESGPHTLQQDEHRHQLFELNAAAATYFHNLLASSAGAQTRKYLFERELTAETIATFQLGYALDEWEDLKRHLMQRGYSAQTLLAAGLIVERDNGSNYDRFRHRLTIPIRDTKGRVIGFGARALAKDQVPKYLNTPQTELFDKSATLYGLDLARQTIRETGQVVIVEGYMDVIQAHQRGARNVVAQMGTALTEFQLKRLARLTNRITLALDADTAGNTATLRGLNLARQFFLPKRRRTAVNAYKTVVDDLPPEIYIAALPVGQDPDDVLKKGLDTWEALIDQAIPILDFYETLILGQADLTTPQGKSLVVRELIPIYREIRDNVEKSARVQRLARKIGIDERLLDAELKREPAKSTRKTDHHSPSPEPGVSPLPKAVTSDVLTNNTLGMELEEYCLALILTNPSALAIANDILENQDVEGLTVDDFKRGEHREIFKSLQLWTVSETPKIDILVDMVGASLERQLANLAARWHRRPPPPLENINQDLSIAVLRLRLQNVIEQIEELTLLQRQAPEVTDIRYYTELVERYRQQRLKLEHTRDALTLTGKRRAEANLYGQVI